MVPKIGRTGAAPAESRHGLVPAPAADPIMEMAGADGAGTAFRLFRAKIRRV